MSNESIPKSAVADALKYHFGFESFKGNQQDVIHTLLEGHDVFVLMPTGAGKSLCYQLPAMMSDGVAIVISPLIALMKNQVDSMRHYGEQDGVAHFLNSSLTKAAANEVKRDVREGRTKLLYVAPESLVKRENIEFLRSIRISFYAIDEAHCISEWGHDFRPEYGKLRAIMDDIGRRPVIALTATATPKVQHDIIRNLDMNDFRVFKSSFNRPNLYYDIRPKGKDVEHDIIRYIKQHKGRSGIIYCLSRKRVEDLAEMLRINDIKALPYHAGMDAVTRAENQDAFLHEDVDVIVATVAFGMGIDKPDVRYVIHYDLPKSIEGYYQETGRAGRDGGEGVCIMYYSAKDMAKLEKLLQTKSPAELEIARQLLRETAEYAESNVCRRKILMHYFGEEYAEDNCHSCDNCSHPKNEVDATEELLTALETIQLLHGKRKLDYVQNILVGRGTDEIRSYYHQTLETFGALKHREDRFVHAMLQQAVIAGYINRDIENYGNLQVSDFGLAELAAQTPKSFFIVEDNDYSDADYEIEGRGGTAADSQLFSILKDLRRKVAKRMDLPPYVIFSDPSLEAMATTYPITTEEMLGIPGVGKGKMDRFGKEFLDVIKQHVKENEIIRPTDIVVRQVATGSQLKVYLIQGIDRRIDLDQLAESRGIEFDELLDALESIVEGGTKINIKYFMDALLDDERQEDLYDYFRETEEDDIEAAINELGDEYSEEEIRLARIQFISNSGN